MIRTRNLLRLRCHLQRLLLLKKASRLTEPAYLVQSFNSVTTKHTLLQARKLAHFARVSYQPTHTVTPQLLSPLLTTAERHNVLPIVAHNMLRHHRSTLTETEGL